MLIPRNAAVVLALLCPLVSFAKKPPTAEPPVHQPLISRPLHLLAQDNFDRAALGGNWRVAGGHVGMDQGELKVTIDENDGEDVKKATAIANFVRKGQNVGVVCRVKNVSANLTVVGITRADEGTGFVAAVHFQKSGKVAVVADHGILDTSEEVVDQSDWMDLMIETVGPRIVVQVNGKKVIDAESPSIQRSPKRGIAMTTVDGESRMDNLMVGEVAPKQ